MKGVDSDYIVEGEVDENLANPTGLNVECVIYLVFISILNGGGRRGGEGAPGEIMKHHSKAQGIAE